MNYLTSLVTESNKKWWVFASFALVFVIINLDLTIVNVALPTIGFDMHSTLAQMQWVINVFTMVLACLLIIFSNICQRYGAVKVYIVGNLLFLMGSVLSGMSMSESMLIGARIIQAIGMAAIFNPCFMIPLSYFPESRKGFLVSCIISISGISMAIGPNIGGFIIEYFNWRWIFFLNVPLCIATILMTRWLCGSSETNKSIKIDYVSSALLSLGITALIYALNNMNAWGACSVHFISVLFGSIISLLLFTYSQHNKQHKTIDFSIFRNKTYSIVITIRVLFLYSFFVVLFVSPFYLQNIQGMSPSKSALILAFLSGTFGLLSPFVGKVCDRVGFIWPTRISMVVATIGFGLMATIGMNSSIYFTIVSYVLIGMAAAIVMSATAGISTRVLPIEKVGNGMAVYFTAGLLGGTAGVGLSISMMSMLSRIKFEKIIHTIPIVLPNNAISTLEKIASGTQPIGYINGLVANKDLQQIGGIVKSCYLHGYSITSLSLCLLCFLGLVLSFKLRNTK